jgi:hypothetical protein
METQFGTKWIHLATPLDDSWWPDIRLISEAPVLFVVELAHHRAVGIYFEGVEYMEWTNETIYWSICAEPTRPRGFMSEIASSKLLPQICAVRPLQPLRHYVMHGEDVWEVVAIDVQFRSFDFVSEVELHRQMIESDPHSWRGRPEI